MSFVETGPAGTVVSSSRLVAGSPVILPPTREDSVLPFYRGRAPDKPDGRTWLRGCRARREVGIVPVRNSDPFVAAAGVFIALAVIGLTGYLVVQLSVTSPAVAAAVLTSFAAVLAAIPPIIKALRGR